MTAGGWLLAGARTVLDLIGYSTAPEDVEVARTRLDKFLEWLLSLPWWAPWGFALVATIWLMWVSWPRRTQPAATASGLASVDRTAATARMPGEDTQPAGAESKSAATTSPFFFEHRPPVFIHHRLDENGKRWITVRLKFHTVTDLKNAKPYLLSVRRYESGQWSEDLLAGARLMLSWIGSGNRFESRNIHNDEHFLLLDYSLENNILSFTIDKKHAPYSVRELVNNIPPGKYLLSVGIAAENTGRMEENFILDWFGDFDLLALKRADEKTA